MFDKNLLNFELLFRFNKKYVAIIKNISLDLRKDFICPQRQLNSNTPVTIKLILINLRVG